MLQLGDHLTLLALEQFTGLLGGEVSERRDVGRVVAPVTALRVVRNYVRRACSLLFLLVRHQLILPLLHEV